MRFAIPKILSNLVPAAVIGSILTLAGCAAETTEAASSQDSALESSTTPTVFLGNAGLVGIGRPGTPYIQGDVFVRNLARDKTVDLVMTTDGWKSSRLVHAWYQDGAENGYEKWSFSELVSRDDKIEFSVAYTAVGKTYWDNNRGHNYQLDASDFFTSNHIPPLCQISFGEATTAGDVTMQIKARNVSFQKTVSASWDVDWGTTAQAEAHWVKTLADGRDLFEVSGRLASPSTSPYPYFHGDVTCTLAGNAFRADPLLGSFPLVRGTKE